MPSPAGKEVAWATTEIPTAHPAGQARGVTYVVLQVAVAARLGQQQLNDLHVPVLAGAHERGGALVVLDVDVGPAGQQALHHVDPPVTDGQHEGCLSRLWGGMAGHLSGTRWPGGWEMGVLHCAGVGGGGHDGVSMKTQGTKHTWD